MSEMPSGSNVDAWVEIQNLSNLVQDKPPLANDVLANSCRHDLTSQPPIEVHIQTSATHKVKENAKPSPTKKAIRLTNTPSCPAPSPLNPTQPEK